MGAVATAHKYSDHKLVGDKAICVEDIISLATLKSTVNSFLKTLKIVDLFKNTFLNATFPKL